MKSEGAGVGSTIKGTDCSCRKPRVSSHMATPVPKSLTPSSDFHVYCTHMAHRHVGKASTHISKLKRKKGIKMSKNEIYQLHVTVVKWT